MKALNAAVMCMPKTLTLSCGIAAPLIIKGEDGSKIWGVLSFGRKYETHKQGPCDVFTNLAARVWHDWGPLKEI